MTVERNDRRTRTGVVVSNKMDKTITVAVERSSSTQLKSMLTMRKTSVTSVIL